MSGYSVGQRVWVYDGIHPTSGPREGTVTKVGRTLVTVATGTYGTESKYRIEDGSFNSRDYPHHSSIKTDEQRSNDERRAKAWERIKATRTLDSRPGGGRLSADALERIADIVEAETRGGIR